MQTKKIVSLFLLALIAVASQMARGMEKNETNEEEVVIFKKIITIDEYGKLETDECYSTDDKGAELTIKSSIQKNASFPTKKLASEPQPA